MSRIKSYGPSLVLAGVAFSVLAGGPMVVRQLAYAEQSAEVEKTREQLRTSPLAQLNSAFRQVARVVEPSVVHISVSHRVAAGEGSGRMSPEDMLRRFFRGLPEDEDMPNPRKRGPRQAPRNAPQQDYDEYDVPEAYGAGSGWVYSDGKHIITNNHVVEGADEILVKFYDKSTVKATIVGTDPQTDIAVLKLPETKGLHASKVAADGVAQGDMVFAFGSPFQFEFSMSQGIVSGTARELGILRNVRGYENFIQTDAAINPGNSGGPLTNIQGEVIGMNTAIATRTGAYNGLGFAIPADMIRSVVDQIVKTGKVSRGYLGVWIKDLDEKLAKSFGYTGKGVLVEDMVEGASPAAKAGIKAGDIITEINGEPVTSGSELRRIVANVMPGQTTKINIFRDGKTQVVDVKVTEAPAKVADIGKGGGPKVESPVPDDKLEPLRKLGFAEVSTFTDEAAKELGTEFVGGVLVENVRSGSVAYAEGLRPGAIITQVQGKAVKSLEELAREMAKADLAEGVRLRVRVDNVNRFVFLQLGK